MSTNGLELNHLSDGPQIQLQSGHRPCGLCDDGASWRRLKSVFHSLRLRKKTLHKLLMTVHALGGGGLLLDLRFSPVWLYMCV